MSFNFNFGAVSEATEPERMRVDQRRVVCNEIRQQLASTGPNAETYPEKPLPTNMPGTLSTMDMTGIASAHQCSRPSVV